MLGLDAMELFVVRLILVEIAIATVLVVWLGPKIAARRVRAEAGEVFREEIAPQLIPLVRAEVAAVVASADARIAAGRAELEAERDKLVAEFEARAAPPLPEHQSAEHMAAISPLGVEARAVRAQERASAEASLIAAIGPAYADLLRKKWPQLYKTAIDAGDGWREIVAPLLEKARASAANGNGRGNAAVSFAEAPF